MTERIRRAKEAKVDERLRAQQMAPVLLGPPSLAYGAPWTAYRWSEEEIEWLKKHAPL